MSFNTTSRIVIPLAGLFMLILLVTVTAAATTPSITVTSPDGGETWQRGTSHTVTWSYTGNPGSNVKLVLVKGGTEVGTIIASTSIGSGGTGSYTWDISSGAGLSTGSDFKVSVQSISQPTIKDVSNNCFTLTSATTSVTAATPTPTITVTSPNGGESWPRGTSHTVSWSYTGSPGSTVEIDLVKGGTIVGAIANSVPVGSSGQGSYTWSISSTTMTGSEYKVIVQSTSQPAIKDTSNGYFTITSAATTTTPSIIVTSPKGGDLWYKYTWRDITWSYTGSPGSTVKIVLLKGGTSVGTIADNVPIGNGGKGSYSWFVWTTLTSGSEYKVSVQSKSQPAINDMTDVNFRIYWP